MNSKSDPPPVISKPKNPLPYPTQSLSHTMQSSRRDLPGLAANQFRSSGPLSIKGGKERRLSSFFHIHTHAHTHNHRTYPKRGGGFFEDSQTPQLLNDFVTALASTRYARLCAHRSVSCFFWGLSDRMVCWGPFLLRWTIGLHTVPTFVVQTVVDPVWCYLIVRA